MSQPDPAPPSQQGPRDPDSPDAEPDSEVNRLPQAGSPTMLEQMGGISGVVSTVVPVLVFVPVNNLVGLRVAVVAAVAAALAVMIWRLVRKERVQPAISGLLAVGLCAFIAYRTGEARNYFLFGIWSSLVFGAGFLASVLVRWPLVGVIWHYVNGRGQQWRQDRVMRRAYTVATLVWVVVFAARFVVQQWLYDADAATALGIARLAMGVPLTALAALVTIWQVHRATRRRRDTAPAQ